MTSRALYDGVLIELHKENAPNILLEDFNYFANKAVNQYINKRYNIYDVNQQTTDDLRVLKATAVLTPHKVEDIYDGLSLADMATYYVDLPTDYLHLLNCICIYNVKKTYKCYNAGDTWRAAATRLTADAYSQVLDNFWTKPSYKRPYYYIHNININETIPTNPYNNGEGTDRDNAIIDKIENNNIIGYIVKEGKGREYEDLTEEGFYLVHYTSSDDDVIYRFSTRGDLNNDKKVNVLDDLLMSNMIQNGEYSLKADLNNDGVVNNIDKQELENIILSNKIYYSPETNVYYKTLSGEIYKIENTSSTKKWKRIENTNYPENYDRSGNLIINYSDQNMFSSVDISGIKTSNIERASQVRYGNASRVRLEIRYGTDNSVFTLDLIEGKKGGKIYIDYIKSPLHIRLTQEEIDYTEDKSQVLEFPDYVCQEILNELVHLVMENISDLRLQTHPIVSLSIANPTQQLAPEAAGQSA